MQTSIDIRPELAQQLTQLASREGRTLTAILEEAVTELLAKRQRPVARTQIEFPVAGDPARRMTEEEFKAAVEQAQQREDLRRIGGLRDSA